METRGRGRKQPGYKGQRRLSRRKVVLRVRGGERTLDEKSKSRSDIERIEDGKGRWRKKEAFSFARVFFRVYLYARANFIYTGPSKVNADVARGMSEGERRVERKRTKESSVDGRRWWSEREFLGNTEKLVIKARVGGRARERAGQENAWKCIPGSKGASRMKPRDEETKRRGREREREWNRRKAEKRWEKPRAGRLKILQGLKRMTPPCRREIIPRFFPTSHTSRRCPRRDRRLPSPYLARPDALIPLPPLFSPLIPIIA